MAKVFVYRWYWLYEVLMSYGRRDTKRLEELYEEVMHALAREKMRKGQGGQNGA